MARGAEERPQRSADAPHATKAAAPLGIYAETYSTPLIPRVSADSIIWADTGEGTGELIPYEGRGDKAKPVVSSQAVRAERYALKSAARRLLPKDHRTTKCMNWRVPDQEIQIRRGATTDKAFYHGLQVCAMPWTCPVCASKISERRRQEVARAIKQAEALGLEVRLLTLTIPHGVGDDVSSMVDAMSKAWTKLWQGRQGVQLRESLLLAGHIRALEVTHGANGFHPHFHALLFVWPGRTKEENWEALTKRWQKVTVRAGLPSPDPVRGCRVDDGEKASAYVAKGVWGLESEVTKGHVKKGKRGSRTPFDLLRDYMAGDKKAGALWRVYADAFAGRRQLYWSNGLKKMLAIAELSDEEIANRPDDEKALLLARVTDEQWRLIYRRGLVSAVLDLAESSADCLLLFLGSLVLKREVV